MLAINEIKNRALEWRGFIIDALFPIECLGCGVEGVWLCENCKLKLTYRQDQHCLGCKRINSLGQFCPECKSGYFLDGVITAGDYDNMLLAKMIKFLKYHFTQDLSKNLGGYLHEFINDHEDISNTISGSLVIPVPLHKRRWLWRGFNQAELIADHFARRQGLRSDCGSLTRIRNNPPQVKFKENQRKNNVIDCFAWLGQPLSGQDILLIDDIVTTGATLNECAKVLKQNGAGRVWGLVAAKG